MNQQAEDAHAQALDDLAKRHDAGEIGDARYELDRSRLEAKAPKKKSGSAASFFAVIGIIAVLILAIRIGTYIYAKATEPDRWVEQSSQSCKMMLALLGGDGSSLAVTKTGQVVDLPSFKVTGGILADQSVYCLNFVQGTDRTVGASSVFLLDGTRV